MKEVLARLFNSHSVPKITYEQLSDAPGLSRIALDPGIHTTPIPLYENRSLLFYTEMDKQSRFLNHSHDCKEIITVMKGSIILLGQVYLTGQVAVVYPNVGHSPKALEDTELYVEFLRPPLSK